MHLPKGLQRKACAYVLVTSVNIHSIPREGSGCLSPRETAFEVPVRGNEEKGHCFSFSGCASNITKGSVRFSRFLGLPRRSELLILASFPYLCCIFLGPRHLDDDKETGSWLLALPAPRVMMMALAGNDRNCRPAFPRGHPVTAASTTGFLLAGTWDGQMTVCLGCRSKRKHLPGQVSI